MCHSISFSYLLECDDSGTMVQCYDGTCIDGNLVCDGEVDCPDYEYEDVDGNLVNSKDNEDEYLCPEWWMGTVEFWSRNNGLDKNEQNGTTTDQ